MRKASLKDLIDELNSFTGLRLEVSRTSDDFLCLSFSGPPFSKEKPLNQPLKTSKACHKRELFRVYENYLTVLKSEGE